MQVVKVAVEDDLIPDVLQWTTSSQGLSSAVLQSVQKSRARGIAAGS